MIITRGSYFFRYYPQHMILLSLIISTCVGTILLALPMARTTHVSFIDLFFTSASLTTVTGLMTVPIESFSNFGHIIMLCLMQLGGLGLMTLSLSFVYMFSNLGIYTQVIASEVLSLKSFKETKETLLFIIKLTAVTETMGAILVFPTMHKNYPFGKALFYAIFHSISSFCNAGFCLFPDKMMAYNNNYIMIFTTTALMIAGGLGFFTWHELTAKYLLKRTQLAISWHTKLVLRMYLYTSACASLLFWLIERNGCLAGMPFFQKFSVVIFTGIAMKSTGFVLTSFMTVSFAALVICMVSMFIGSAPLSTGSGIKTSVFAIYLAVIKAAIQGKRQALLYGRHIIDDQVYKAMAIIALSLSWIVIISFCLLLTEPTWEFIDVLFGTVAAFSNNGTTIQDVELMTSLGKCLIIISMLIGRIGALALILSMKRIGDFRELSYPKEHVILG